VLNALSLLNSHPIPELDAVLTVISKFRGSLAIVSPVLIALLAMSPRPLLGKTAGACSQVGFQSFETSHFIKSINVLSGPIL
jgi:hypothetical protein